METGLVPVSVLVGQVLAVAADGFPALLAGAGVEGLEARHAVGALLPQDVLLAKERAFAMVAIKALGHFDTGFSTTLSEPRIPPGRLCVIPVHPLVHRNAERMKQRDT